MPSPDRSKVIEAHIYGPCTVCGSPLGGYANFKRNRCKIEVPDVCHSPDACKETVIGWLRAEAPEETA